MNHIRPEDLIIIDIETAAEHPSYDVMAEAWKALWDEKVIRSVPGEITTAAFYPMRAGVMAEFAKIICISIGYLNKETTLQLRIKSFYGHNELTLLSDFITTLNKIEQYNNKWCFAGHNIKEFDIPFICRRLLINNLAIPNCLNFQNMKPWETNIVDTFQYWRFGDYKNYTSLNLLATAMNVPSSKDDIDGSMVGELYWTENVLEKENNLKRIVTYCQKDVLTTANIILRFKHIPLLHPADVEIVE